MHRCTDTLSVCLLHVHINIDGDCHPSSQRVALIHGVILSQLCVKSLLGFSCFLLQGRYQVKFLVDGQWRIAPDWPTVQSQHGTNNVLQVD